MDMPTTEAVIAVLVAIFVAVPPLAILAFAAARATPSQLAEMLTARDSHTA